MFQPRFLLSFLFVAVVTLPFAVLAQNGSSPADGGGSVPTFLGTPVPAETPPTTPPRQTELNTPTPLATTSLEPSSSVAPENTVENEQQGNTLAIVGVVMAVTVGAGILGFNFFKKEKSQKKEENKCESIKELLEQKKRELEEMVHGWPEEKLKAIAQDKALDALKKNETVGQGIEIAEAVKEKYDKLQETIELLQQKYDLCMLDFNLNQKIVVVESKPEYEQEAREVIYDQLRKLGRIKNSQVASFDSDLNHISEIYQGRSRFWVAISEEKVIGTIAIKEIDMERCELQRMYLLSEFHGQNVAKMLLADALKFAREKNYKKITLETNKVMTRAQRFYQKNGFVQTGEKDDKLIFELQI